MSAPSHPWVGRSIERVEDAALVTGRGRYIDDLGVAPGPLHAAILRSPHAQAAIKAIRTAAAAAMPGVAALVTGADVACRTASLAAAVRAPSKSWPIAVDRVRYVGEPVAVAGAGGPCLGRDALEPLGGAPRTVARRVA